MQLSRFNSITTIMKLRTYYKELDINTGGW